jgi:hypothetical protein
VFPTTPQTAAPIGQDHEIFINGKSYPLLGTYIQNTDPGSNAGIPGITIPSGFTSEGLPVGLEFDGAQNSDEKLIEICELAEGILNPCNNICLQKLENQEVSFEAFPSLNGEEKSEKVIIIVIGNLYRSQLDSVQSVAGATCLMS